MVEVLEKQYAKIKAPDAVANNIRSLGDKNTFTVTTGHQLNLCTGPLYFIYKIVTVINATKALNKKYPGYHFVPVYWMASEDHDFEEISYFKLNGKKFTWKTDQTGAVGRFNPKSIQPLLDGAPGDFTLFKKAYSSSNTLSDAARYYVNELLGSEGVVVIDADNVQLKSAFRKIVKDDVLNHTAKSLVEEKNQALEKLGYHPQVFAREINFFYLDGSVRSRLEKVGDGFGVVDTQIQFTRKEVEQLIEREPEKFSPNVVMRPLYQEVILPNLAYVGGPAEVVYWLQLKAVFDHYKVPFPMLMPRNFALVIDAPNLRKWEKTALTLEDVFMSKDQLFERWVGKNTEHNLKLEGEMARATKLFGEIEARSSAVDVTLTPMVSAEAKRAMKSIEKIEHKLLRAEKRKHKEKLGQIEAVKDALFPNGSPQERTENFMLFQQQDKKFIPELLNQFDPFDYTFNILTY